MQVGEPWESPWRQLRSRRNALLGSITRNKPSPPAPISISSPVFRHVKPGGSQNVVCRQIQEDNLREATLEPEAEAAGNKLRTGRLSEKNKVSQKREEDYGFFVSKGTRDAQFEVYNPTGWPIPSEYYVYVEVEWTVTVPSVSPPPPKETTAPPQGTTASAIDTVSPKKEKGKGKEGTDGKKGKKGKKGKRVSRRAERASVSRPRPS